MPPSNLSKGQYEQMPKWQKVTYWLLIVVFFVGWGYLMGKHFGVLKG